MCACFVVCGGSLIVCVSFSFPPHPVLSLPVSVCAVPLSLLLSHALHLPTNQLREAAIFAAGTVADAFIRREVSSVINFFNIIK